MKYDFDNRAPDKMCKLHLTLLVLCLHSNPMFDHLLESSRWDDSNKWSNIGFSEEIGIIEIKIHTLYGALDNACSMGAMEACYRFPVIESGHGSLITFWISLAHSFISESKSENKSSFFHWEKELRWAVIISTWECLYMHYLVSVNAATRDIRAETFCIVNQEQIMLYTVDIFLWQLINP